MKYLIFIQSINNGTNPKLVDDGVKLFFKEVLKGCNKYKQTNYNTFYNLIMFSAFCLILGILLYTRYKGSNNYKSYYENEDIIYCTLSILFKRM